MTTDEKIKCLASLGEKQGYITYDEINKTFPDSMFSPEELEKVHFELLLLGLQIIDQAPEKDSDREA
jgi:RNA polymerase primary sigma factor